MFSERQNPQEYWTKPPSKILILDASWSYLASPDGPRAALPKKTKDDWLKFSKDLRQHHLALLGTNEQGENTGQKLTYDQALAARAHMIENVKTPGRNCYLSPYMSGKPEFRELYRIVGGEMQCVEEFDGTRYPWMNSMGRGDFCDFCRGPPRFSRFCRGPPRPGG